MLPTYREATFDPGISTRTPDTPGSRKTLLSASAYLDLKAGRTALKVDIGTSIPQVTTRAFFEQFLPLVPHGIDVNAVVEELSTGSDPAIVGGRWKHFHTQPRLSSFVEDTAFMPFTEVVASIIATPALRDFPRTLEFQQAPSQIPAYSLRRSTDRPDGYGYKAGVGGVGKNSKVNWVNIALSAQYKKSNTSINARNDNVGKIVWDLNQTMRDDVRRRFTFGFTLENTDMRLWYCDRSNMVVSDAFDFDLDHHTFVRFFVTMLYGDEHQIGWDPSISLAPGCLDRYDIVVCGENGEERIFRTRPGKPLSTVGAEALHGKGTRVWKVNEIKDNVEQHQTYILKDSWIDEDREREGDIILKLRGSTQSEEDERVLTGALFTIESHGDVFIDKERDCTRTLSDTLEKSEFLLELPQPTDERNKAASLMVRVAIGSPEDAPDKVSDPAPEYHRKVHYRIVFNEVGIPLHEITSLRRVFSVLTDTSVALVAMHVSGWVHRDVSATNILVVNDRAKIGDLEYAKREKQDAHHNIRTLNNYFVAVEVEHRRYLFLPPELLCSTKKVSSFSRQKYASTLFLPPDQARDTRLAETSFAYRATTSGPIRKSPTPRDHPVFVYNPLHDLESLWWIAVYFVTNRGFVRLKGGQAPHSVWDDDPRRIAGQRSFACSIFNDRLSRMQVFLTTGHFSMGLPLLHPSILYIGEKLEELRGLLVEAYHKAETNIAGISFDVASNLGDKFAEAFEEIAGVLSVTDVEVTRFEIVPLHDDLSKDTPANSMGPPVLSGATARSVIKKMQKALGLEGASLNAASSARRREASSNEGDERPFKKQKLSCTTSPLRGIGLTARARKILHRRQL